MSEKSPEIPQPKILPRRNFIRIIGKGGVALGVGAVTGGSIGKAIEKLLPEDKQNKVTITPNPEAPSSKPTELKPQLETQPLEPLPPGLPEDTLSPEQLQKNNVRVIQSENVQLYLRDGIFDFQLFKDARDGIVSEAVIVLVDSPVLEKAAIEQLPEEPRTLYLATHPYPKESTDYRFLGEFINTNVLLSEEIINAGFENSQRARDLIEAHPEIKNRAYIFIAIGGELKPHPQESYPKPLPQLEITFEIEGRVFLHTPLRSNSGFIMRHELGHYKNPTDLNLDELNLDRSAVKNMADAWNDYYLNGDNTKYPFVFVTNEGITITKNQKAKSRPDSL